MTDILYSDLFIEILGAVTGLIYLIFSIKQNIWLWPWGIITSLLYVFVFYQSKFYADMSLQFYYLGISIYGWHYWLKGKKGDESSEKRITVKRINKTGLVYLLIITFLLTLFAGYGLDNFTDSPLPYWDAFTTAGSIVATWMLARKYLEHWLFWIVIDLVSLGLYFYKSLYPTVFLFAVYTGMAAVGYFEWRKDLTNKPGH